MRQHDSNLVEAPCVEPNENVCVFDAVGCRRDRKHRQMRRIAACAHNARARALAANVRVVRPDKRRRVSAPIIRSHPSAANPGEVPLQPRLCANLRAVSGGRRRIARNHDETAREAIEPMGKARVWPTELRADTRKQRVQLVSTCAFA